MLRPKFTKILSFFKQKISFSSNFASIFSDMRHNSSMLFLAGISYTFKQRNLSKYKLGEIWREQSKVWNFALWWFLLSKSYKVSAKTVQKSYLSWLKSDAKLKEKLTFGFKYDMCEIWRPKYARFELQKYRGVIFHDTEQWCRIWINLDLVVSKIPWGIGWTFIRKFATEK